MGLKLFSTSSFSENSNNTLPNPNPLNYKIVKYAEFYGHYLLVKINYPDCKNHEGNKILLFENCSMDELLKQKKIDPHFSDNKKLHSPIARFEPTNKGWDMAVVLIKSLSNKIQ